MPCAPPGRRRSRSRSGFPPTTGSARRASRRKTPSTSRACWATRGSTSSTCRPDRRRREARPVYGRMFQTPFSDRIRNETGIATMAVGNIYEPDHVNSILMAGRADLCCLARPHLADPYWTLHAAAQLGYRGETWPKPYLAGRDQLHRVQRRRTRRQPTNVEQRRDHETTNVVVVQVVTSFAVSSCRPVKSHEHARSPAHALQLAGRRHRRRHLARSTRAEEPADVRLVCRAARRIPRARRRRRHQGRRHRVEWRQLLLRWRRPRHHRSIADARHEGAARLHADDRRSGQGDTRLPAAGDRGRRRRVRRRRRDDRPVFGSAPRDACGQDRVSLHPGRPRRLRHGRVRDAAACHRPGARRRAAAQRPDHVGGRGRALGLLQPPRGRRRARGRGARRWREALPTARHSRT